MTPCILNLNIMYSVHVPLYVQIVTCNYHVYTNLKVQTISDRRNEESFWYIIIY